MRVVFIYSNMKFKLRRGVDPPQPGDLIGVAYGGAGTIWPSVFIDARLGNGHFIVKHFVLGWRTKKTPDKIDAKWVRMHSDRIYGEKVCDRIMFTDSRMLTEDEKHEYNKIKQALNEHKDHWAVHPI